MYLGGAETDFSKSLDELQGFEPGDPNEAPTPLVRAIIEARAKPMDELRADEIGRLIVQLDGLPFILDLAFLLLEEDPLFDGGYYPGDVLSNLIQAPDEAWSERESLRERLKELYDRAMGRPLEDKETFLDSLDLPNSGKDN